jgi:hypothetical protein
VKELAFAERKHQLLRQRRHQEEAAAAAVLPPPTEPAPGQDNNHTRERERERPGPPLQPASARERERERTPAILQRFGPVPQETPVRRPRGTSLGGPPVRAFVSPYAARQESARRGQA